MIKIIQSRLAGKILWLSLAVAVSGAIWSPVAVAADPDAGDEMLGRAEAMLNSDMVKLARSEYRSFLKQYPNHNRVSEGQYGLAICLYRLDNYSAAAAQLQKMLEAGDFHGRGQAMELLSQCYLSGGDYKNARRNLEKLLSDHPTGPHVESARVSLAQALYMLGEKAKSLTAFEKFLKTYPKSKHVAAANFYIAQCRLDLKQYDKAIEALKLVVDSDKTGPRGVEASKFLAQCYEAKGKYDLAESNYLAFILKAPKDRKAEGYLSLALNYYRAGKYARAIESLNILLKKYPSSAYARPGRMQLGLTQFACQQYTAARKTLELSADKSAIDAPEAQYWIARCDMALGDNASAHAVLKRLASAKTKPVNLERISFDMVICLVNMGKWETASKASTDFCRNWPESPLATAVTYHNASCLHQLKAFLQSSEACRKVLKDTKSPHAGAAGELLAENMFALGLYPKAEKAFTALLKSKPNNKRYMLRLGQCAYHQKNYKSTASHLSSLGRPGEVAKNPTLSRSLFLLGCCQLQLKRNVQAAESLKAYLTTAKLNRNEATYRLAQAQQRGGKSKEANITLLDLFWNSEKLSNRWAIRAAFDYGYNTFSKGEYKLAVGALEKVAQSDAPDELAGPTAYMLAWVDFNGKRYDRAADKFAQVTARWPKHKRAPSCVYYRGVSLHRAGKNKRAVAIFEQYLKDHPSGPHANDARNMMIACMQALGKTSEATKSLTALSKDPKTRSAAVLYQLAWMQRKQKNIDAAITTYNALIKEFPKYSLIKTTRCELADLTLARKDYTATAKLLSAALKDKSGSTKSDATIAYRLGRCLLLSGQARPAADAFESFAGKYPKHPHATLARYQTAMIYAKLKDLPNARKQLIALLRVDTTSELSQSAQIALGNFYATDGDFAAAGEAYALFLDRYPKSKQLIQGQYGMGWTLHNREKYAEARQWYEKVVSADKGLTAAKAQLQIGRTYWSQGKFTRGAKELLKAETLYNNPQVGSKALYEAGLAFEKLRDVRMAIKQYRLCVKKYRSTPSAKLAGKRIGIIAPSTNP
jgi:TolA-binding protein